MQVQIFHPEGIDNAGLLRLVEKAKEKWPDSNMHLSERTKKVKGIVKDERGKGKTPVYLPVFTSPHDFWDFESPALDGLKAAIAAVLRPR